MLYYEDRRTGSIYSLTELCQMIAPEEVTRFEVPRRFRRLPESCCRLLDEAKIVAAMASRGRDPWPR